MLTIKSVRITNLRSFSSQLIDDINEVNVFFGMNDSGKSNILKALNLFFNNELSNNMIYDYDIDYNLYMKSIRKKEKRLLKVEIVFQAPDTYKLRDFKILRTWTIDGQMTSKNYYMSNALIKNSGINAAISGLLNRTRYIYCPALRTESFLSYLFSILQESMLNISNREIGLIIEQLADIITEEAAGIEEDFLKSTGLNVEITLPQQIKELYKSFYALTDLKELANVKGSIEINRRGEGIQQRFIVSLLHFISRYDTNTSYIWGLEEPENSLEYNLQCDLGDSINTRYSEYAQIFITSHSPTFICNNNNNCNIYSVSKDENGCTTIEACKEDSLKMQRLNSIHSMYVSYVDALKDITELQSRIDSIEAEHIIICEGECDMQIIINMWNILNPSKKMDDKKIGSKRINFELIKGETNDALPESGSKIREIIAKRLSAKGKRVIILEDRDRERNNGNVESGNWRRTRLTRTNIDNYFISPRILAKAFKTSQKEIEKMYNDVGLFYLEDEKWHASVDGKKILEEINQHFGRSFERGNFIESSELVNYIDETEIHEDFIELLQHVKWMISQ